MLRAIRISIGVGVLMVASASGARAQYGYPGGYGGYGWGGWGSTPQGNMARGLGAFAMGAGQYNVNTAQANAINADTVMRWNQATWAAQHAVNLSWNANRIRRRQENIQAQAGIYDRLRNNPNELDIENGDALNVAFDELTNPKVFSSTIRSIKAPLSAQLIRDIPFQHASEALTICLDEMTAQDGWPPALREEAFASDRKAVQDAIKVALAEDEKGDLTPKTIQNVSDAVSRLHAKFEAKVPQTSPDYIPASDHIKALAGVAHMLHSPQVEEIVAGLEKYPGTTVGDLLVFMHAYDLRFSPATTVRQREIYQQLFPILDSVRDGASGTEAVAAQVKNAAEGVVNKAGQVLGSAESGLSSAADSFFKGMGWEHASGQPTR
jgi:hypothetical protein